MTYVSLKAMAAIAIGLGLGLRLSWAARRRSRDMARAQNWRSTPGRILESTLCLVDGKRHTRVRYEFTALERIEGATPRISGDWFYSARAQKAFVARWAPGQSVEVFFDPADPRQNCLDRTDRSGITALWVIALVMAALAALGVWFLSEEIRGALG